MNEMVAIQASGNIIEFDEDKVALIKRTVAKNASDDQLALFLHQCQKTGLDPLARQIYCVMRWNKRDERYDMSIQTAIDGYRLIADRTGKYAGSDDYTFNRNMSQFDHMINHKDHNGDLYPITATATVYKLVGSIRVPFTATVSWESYYPGSGTNGFMWRKLPYLMPGKCAEAIALRKAFPAELSGVYVREEMEQAGFVEVEPAKELLASVEIDEDGLIVGDNIPEDASLSDNGNEPDESATCDAERVKEWRGRAKAKNITVGTLASIMANACPDRFSHEKHAVNWIHKNTDLEANEQVDTDAALEIFDKATEDALAALDGENDNDIHQKRRRR